MKVEPPGAALEAEAGGGASLHTKRQDTFSIFSSFLTITLIYIHTHIDRCLHADFKLERHRDVTSVCGHLRLYVTEKKKVSFPCIFKWIIQAYLCRRTVTCIEFSENVMFRIIGIEIRYVINVADAIPEATDLKISFAERLNVLDFLPPI